MQCVYACEVWYRCFEQIQVNINLPTETDILVEWWMRCRTGFARHDKRGFDTLIIATIWNLWKQRNAHVFNRNDEIRPPASLAQKILEEVKLWRDAGVGVGGLLRFVRE